MRKKIAYLLRRFATRLNPVWCEGCGAPVSVCRGACGPIEMNQRTLGTLVGYPVAPPKRE